MGEQLIISISREYGSGGHEIARKLADRLELAFYDRCMLDEIAEQMNADVSDFHKYDEKPGNRLLSRRVGNHTNSYEEIIAQFQFDYIRKKADKEHKIQRVMEHFDLSESEAYTKMRRHDRTRKQYHNRYSEGKWGDATYYDMCINSSPLGIEKTVNVLENYVKERTGNQEL